MRIRGIRYTMNLGRLSMAGTGSGSGFSPYLVQVSITDLNIRKGPGTNYGKTGKYTGKGVFTIVEEADGTGSVPLGQAEIRRGVDLAGLHPQDLTSSLIAC